MLDHVITAIILVWLLVLSVKLYNHKWEVLSDWLRSGEQRRQFESKLKEVGNHLWPEQRVVEKVFGQHRGELRGWAVKHYRKWEPTLQSQVMTTEEEAKFILEHPAMIVWMRINGG